MWYKGTINQKESGKHKQVPTIVLCTYVSTVFNKAFISCCVKGVKVDIIAMAGWLVLSCPFVESLPNNGPLESELKKKKWVQV